MLTNLVIEKSNGILDGFEKAHVKSYTKTTKSGKLSQVKEHDDKRPVAGKPYKKRSKKEIINQLNRDIKSVKNDSVKKKLIELRNKYLGE